MDPFSHFGPKTRVLKKQKIQIWMIFDAIRNFQYLKSSMHSWIGIHMSINQYQIKILCHNLKQVET
jgi:hypothetical protein